MVGIYPLWEAREGLLKVRDQRWFPDIGHASLVPWATGVSWHYDRCDWWQEKMMSWVIDRQVELCMGIACCDLRELHPLEAAKKM